MASSSSSSSSSSSAMAGTTTTTTTSSSSSSTSSISLESLCSHALENNMEGLMSVLAATAAEEGSNEQQQQQQQQQQGSSSEAARGDGDNDNDDDDDGGGENGGARAAKDDGKENDAETQQRHPLVQCADQWGWTALHYAAMKGHAEAVEVLLSAGADPEQADPYGDTPLHVAEKWMHAELRSRLEMETRAVCPNQGCDWCGKRAALATHQSEQCEFRQEPCRLGCDLAMRPAEWEGLRVEHEENACPKRLLPCAGGCGRQGIVAEHMEMHLTTDCVKVLEKPTQQWGEKEVDVWLEHVVRLPQYKDVFHRNGVRGPQLLFLNSYRCQDTLNVQVRLHGKRITNAVTYLNDSGANEGHVQWIHTAEAFQASQQRLKDWILAADPNTEDTVVSTFLDVVMDYDMLPELSDMDLVNDIHIDSSLQRDVFLKKVPTPATTRMTPSGVAVSASDPAVVEARMGRVGSGDQSDGAAAGSGESKTDVQVALPAGDNAASAAAKLSAAASSHAVTGAATAGGGGSEDNSLEEELLSDPFMRDHLIQVAELTPANWRTTKIGEGAFGDVYRAQFKEYSVAVKVLKGDSPEVRRELLREVKVAFRVSDHPNIVRVFGVVLEPLAVVSEFMHKGSAWALLCRSNPERPHLSERQLLSMLLDAANGVLHLHNQSPVIVHRDLAARNLLVDDDLHVKVCDFGLARTKQLWQERGVTETEGGALKWSAPEALRGRHRSFNEKMDVYSFGVCCYELATGREPWEDETSIAAAQRVMDGERIPLNPEDGIPRVLQTLMYRCWNTDPDDRPSMPEVVTILESAVAATDAARLYDTM